MGRAEQLRVADFHCDVLSKLQASPHLNFDKDSRLDVTAERLAAGGVGLQVLRFICLRLGEDLVLKVCWDKLNYSRAKC